MRFMSGRPKRADEPAINADADRLLALYEDTELSYYDIARIEKKSYAAVYRRCERARKNRAKQQEMMRRFREVNCG